MAACDRRRRAPSRYEADASVPTTEQPRSARAKVMVPVPQPTSSTRCPVWMPANVRNGSARRALHRAINFSYTSGSDATNQWVGTLIDVDLPLCGKQNWSDLSSYPVANRRNSTLQQRM